jgi:hypothetical protein
MSKTALFEPQPSLEDSARVHQVSTSLDFATLFFLQNNIVSLVSNSNLEDQGMSRTDRVAQFYFHISRCLFVAFYDSQG